MRVRVHNARGALLAGLAISDGVTRVAWPSWPPAPGTTPMRMADGPRRRREYLTLDIGTSDLTQGPNAMSCLVEVSRDS